MNMDAVQRRETITSSAETWTPHLVRLFWLTIAATFWFGACEVFAAQRAGSNTGNVNIPDATTDAPGSWISSSISISGAPSGATVTAIDVYFRCVHPYASDLIVDLNDSAISRNERLWDNEGGSSSNPSKTLNGITTFNGLPVNGTWYLFARDTEPVDTGYIDEWSITIYYANPPTISLNRSTLNATITQGQNAPTQTFEVWNSGGGTLLYSISTDQSWLSAVPIGGISTGEHDSIQVQYFTSGLVPGQYSARVIVSDPNASNSPQYIYVTLFVEDGDDQISEATFVGDMTHTYVKNGVIDTPRDVDMFVFNVRDGQRISFDIDNLSGGLNSHIRLFDSSGTELAFNDDGIGYGEGPSSESYLEYRFLASGTYYLAVSSSGNTSYDPRSGTGDTPGSTGPYTLVLSPGLSGVAFDPADGQNHPVDILRLGDTPLEINSHQTTWIVVHGRESSRTNPKIDALAKAVALARPTDQVLTLDWSGAAADIFTISEDAIPNVAAWAAAALAGYGFNGRDLNFIGHSWGTYVSAETAASMSGGVDTIVGLDPAANALGSYNPNASVKFARESQFSWAFHTSTCGSEFTPTTADEAFVIPHDHLLFCPLPPSIAEHTRAIDVFIYMLANGSRGVSGLFQLERLQRHERGPWCPDWYTSYAEPRSGFGEEGYEGIIEVDPFTGSPESITYVDNCATGHERLEPEIPDNVPPTIAIDYPSSNPNVESNGRSFVVGGIASDNVRVKRFTWTNDRGDGGIIDGGRTFSIGLELQEGQNVITVTAYDVAGNSAADRINVLYAPVILSLGSANPNSGVGIQVSPADNNLQRTGTTPFSRKYDKTSFVTLQAPPTVDCHLFSGWLRDGVQWSPQPTTTLTIDADHTMTATYRTPTYVIDISAAPGGTISPSGSTTLNCGQGISLTATPESGYVIDAWLVDGQSVQAGGTSYLLQDVQANHSIRVTFKCTFEANPPVLAIGYQGGDRAVFITTGNGCTWQPSNTVSWITITSGSNNIGPAALTCRIEENRSICSRTGSVDLATGTIIVTQDGSPFSLTNGLSQCVGNTPFIFLGWTSGATARSYDVFRNGALLTNVTGTTFRDFNVIVGSDYPYFIRAHADTCSRDSETLVVPTRLCPPGQFSLKSIFTECDGSIANVKLTWDPAVGADGYNIFRDNLLIASGLASASFTEQSPRIAPQNMYGYSVVATNGAGNSSSDSQLRITTPDTCGNDLFVHRIRREGISFSARGSTVHATREIGEPTHLPSAGGHSVWWTWTALSNGVATISTYGSSFDTVLAIYSGDSVSNLTLVAVDDDSGGNLTSRAHFSATAGTVYQIAIDGYDDISGQVALRLWLLPDGAPPDIVSDLQLPSGIAAVRYEYLFEAAGAGPFIWSVTSTSLPLGLALDSAGELTGIPAEAGTFVFAARVTDVNGGATEKDFRITIAPASRVPRNDMFADRAIISGSSAAAVGSNKNATREPSEPAHAGRTGGRSLWWSWAAPVSGTATISTRDSSFDTLLGVYTGDSLSRLIEIASNDDAGPDLTSQVTFHAVIGWTYQIAVDGFAEASGDVHLSCVLEPGPQNDDFINRTRLSGANTSATGTSRKASKEPAEPNHASNPGGASVWWTWVAPSNGLIRISTLGSTFDTLLAVYSGASLAELTPIASNDDASLEDLSSQLVFLATANTVYHIAVDGFDAEEGNVRLSVRLAAVPVLSSPVLHPDGSVLLQLRATPEWNYTIETSSNLIDWMPWRTIYPLTPFTDIFDRDALHVRQRFYRAMAY